jgi:MFS family permease
MRTAVTAANTLALRRLFVIQLLSMGAMEMSAPFWPLHLRSLGQLSQPALAWASAVAYAGPLFSAMLLTPLWGRLGDRIGHKPMLLRALLALALTQWWIAGSDSTAMVLTARIVQGALAGFIAASQAYAAGLVRTDRRGSLMARLQIATALGSALGPLAGGWLFDHVGFRWLNLVATAICFGCAIAAWRLLPAATPAPRKTTQEAESHRHFPLGMIQGLLIAILLVQAGKMMPQSFFGLYTEQVLHAPGWLTGLCYGATAIGLCIAAPYWGKRFDAMPYAAVLREAERICWLNVAVVALQAVSRDPALFVLARLLWGVCLAALLPVFYGLLSRNAAQWQLGRVLGAGHSASKAGALAGAGIGGMALAWMPLEHLFWMVAASYAITAAAIRVIRHTPVRALPHDGGA